MNNLAIRAENRAAEGAGGGLRLAIDGDFGEEQITVANIDGFEVGDGVSIWDSRAGGFHTTVARVIGRSRNILAVSHPLNADCLAPRDAQAATVFPVLSGVDIEGARVEDLVVDGARDKNVTLNGCRGAGIYFYRAFGSAIERCLVRSYHGDGISFQQSNDVQVISCVTENNAELGLHPGSGSQRPVVRDCVARNNGTDGLFRAGACATACSRTIKLIGNGRHGISIGHKDSDNVLRVNTVRAKVILTPTGQFLLEYGGRPLAAGVWTCGSCPSSRTARAWRHP